MFGDFSRFENDPEIGLNGIYLSQGSPILDSDWNEQMAALTDWITVVGRLAAGETLRWLGFDVKATTDKKSLTVGPGVALLSGRLLQNTRMHSAAAGVSSRRIIYEQELPKDANMTVDCEVFLVAEERRSDSSSVTNGVMHRNSIRSATEWAVLVRGGGVTVNSSESKGAHRHGPEKIVPARSFGETAHLTPRLKVSWNSVDPLFQQASDNSLLCLLECDTAKETDPNEMRFKWVNCPQNAFQPNEWSGMNADMTKIKILTYSGQGCGALDGLTTPAKVWIEVVDALSDVKLTAALFGSLGSKTHSSLCEYSYDPQRKTLTASNDPVTLSDEVLNPVVRIWHARISSGRGFPFFDPNRKTADPEQNVNGVRAELIFEPDQNLIPGDRWYIPLMNGMPDLKSGDSIAGRRVFRALAKLGTCKISGKGEVTDWTEEQSHIPIAMGTSKPPNVPDQSELSAFPAGPSLRLSSFQPVAHRLDDSLYRLTGALNAARALTRQTPCKELSTRVSYLPLRRWLASTYVHEIVDLDLDSFLAKVRRSVDVAEEDEHRFREQAALVLEEANELAGRVPSQPEPTRRPQDIV